MRLPVVLGKYELVERLAMGGMAEVFLARARGPAGVQKTVVVKRIRPEYAEDPRFVNMFINEARIGVHLAHPNIVQVFELGRAAGTWFIAMEYVHGRDLTRLMRRQRADDAAPRFSDAVAVHIVAELLRGLHHAHSRTADDGSALGLVHQDVSPHNVLLGFDGQVKLLDFGIARALGSEDSATPAGRGKYAYASPEAARGGPVDHRSDQYSAGVVLWELLAGERPFGALEPAAKLTRIQESGLPSLKEIRPDIDPDLAFLVASAASIRPESRHSSAALFEEDLRAWLYDHQSRVGAAEVATVVRGLFPEDKPRVFGVPVQELAEDLNRLDADIGPTPSPRAALPGRLQHSPGERKQVAVLVVDVDGLTDLSGRLEPERFIRRQFRLLRWVRRIVDTWGGLIQRAIDDHLFILFGVPRTREDDLSRAMDCALELNARKTELVSKGLVLDFCMGLHAGEVTVGAARRRVQYMARGNTTRLARRLSAAADHGQVLVSQRVLSSMAADFRLGQGPTIPARGGASGVPSYVLEGRRAGIPLARRGPWLKRGPVVEQLRRAVEGLAAGQGSVLGIVGPVGSGKSRLIQEVQSLARRRAFPFHVVRCAPRGGTAFRELVRSLLGIEPAGGAEQVRAQLRAVAELGITTEGQRHVLGWLAGLPVSALPERSERVLALASLINGLAEDGAILALEAEGMEERDTHTLARVLERIKSPLLALLVMRPPVPEALAAVSEIVELEPFDRGAMHRMLVALLSTETVDDALLDLVDRTCEGNPLYLEEMVKFLLQREQIVIESGEAVLADKNVTLPASLHGLISARIDALDAASKGILQLAAVIGPTFSGALLARAAGLEDPSPLLMELVARGLINRSEEGWVFATELVREAASRGILGVQRRDYHRLVADAIEALHGEEIEAWADDLTTHCALGGRLIDAARYAQNSGQSLERAGLLEPARDRYEAGLRWLASAADPELFDARVQGEASLNLRAGSVSLLLGQLDRGLRALTLALDISSDAGLPWIEVRALIELGRCYLNQGKIRLAGAHLASARAMLPMEDEPELELDALEASATLAFDEGRADDAEGLWKEVLERAANDPARSARCRLGLANRYTRIGDMDRAQPMLHSALREARRAKDRILEGRVLNNIGLVHSWSGHHDEALFHYRRALEVREGIGYQRGVVINHHNIGDVHFQKGHWSRAHVAFSRSRELAERIGWVRGVVLNSVYLAFIDVSRGACEVDILEGELARARALQDPEIITAGAWLLGRYLQESEAPEAREHLERTLHEAREWALMPMVKVLEETIARFP